MKNFLSFTLAAGVALTTAQVAHAAGVTTVSAERAGKSQANMPGTPAKAGRIAFDRNALHRELNRISDLLVPNASANDGLNDESAVAVPKKAVGGFIY